MKSIRTLLVVLALSATAHAQQVGLPGSTPLTFTAGNNTTPFGGSSVTYVMVLPAEELTGLGSVNEIAFAPGGEGTWSATSFKMGIGHLPTSYSPFNPFDYPTIAGGGVAATADFDDLTVAWDSDVQGSFSFTWIARAWSPLGLNGTGFTWDGLRDVGIYLSWDGAVAPSGQSTSFLTSGNLANRHWSIDYQATSQQAFATAGAIAVYLTGATAVPNVIPLGDGCPGGLGLAPVADTDEQLPLIGNGLFTLRVSQGIPGEQAWMYAALAPATQPFALGGGCFFFLDIASTQALMAQGLVPVGPMTLDGNGCAYVPVPLANNPSAAGLSFAVQFALTDTLAPGWTVSSGIHIVIN